MDKEKIEKKEIVEDINDRFIGYGERQLSHKIYKGGAGDTSDINPWGNE